MREVCAGGLTAMPDRFVVVDDPLHAVFDGSSVLNRTVSRLADVTNEYRLGPRAHAAWSELARLAHAHVSQEVVALLVGALLLRALRHFVVRRGVTLLMREREKVD